MATAALFILVGSCSKDESDSDSGGSGTLTIRGSAGTLTGGFGDPSALNIKILRISVGTDADCSSHQLLTFRGSEGESFDLVAGATLLDSSPPDATFHCVKFTMEDTLRFRSAVASGDCAAGTDYLFDFCQTGESWMDEDIAGASPCGGSASTPSTAWQTVFATTNPAALIAQGVDSNQIISMAAPFVIPGDYVFTIDSARRVESTGGACRLSSILMGFGLAP